MTTSSEKGELSGAEPSPFLTDEEPAKAAEYFRLAVQQVNRHNTGLLPLNLALFYYCSAGVSQQLNDALASQLPEDRPWDHDTAVKVFQRYLSPCLDVSIVELQKELLSILDVTVSTVQSAALSSGQRAQTLDQQVVEMSTCKDPRDALRIAGEILKQARSMAAESDALSTTLQSTVNEVSTLRDELSLARRQAAVDSLTGLPNRLVFDTTLDELVAQDRPFALVMLDVDHFKLVNDQHGHLVGDQVLKQVAKVALGNVRATDTVTRYGGEEFAILLPNTPLAEARRIAEKLRHAFEAIRMRRRDSGESIGTITASFGVAEHQRGSSGDLLVAAADRALYSAKRNGRNRVEVETK